MDEWLDWRVRGQRGTGIFFFVAIVCYSLSNLSTTALKLASLVCGVFALIFAGILYYKNVSCYNAANTNRNKRCGDLAISFV